jgi:hypothetical protein
MESEGTNAAVLAREGIEQVGNGVSVALDQFHAGAGVAAVQLADVHIGYWFAGAFLLGAVGLIQGFALSKRIKRMESDVRHNPDVKVGDAIRALQEETQSLAREVKALEYHLSAQRRSTGTDPNGRVPNRMPAQSAPVHARNVRG